ncbi:SDR family NAD(P)-dependent oxidoreductase [candidate division WOR-3 bacterium]|nr:SDR family NAD(P)-dependent oxidoreductase [candidate division WOR-3 bacterium]
MIAGRKFYKYAKQYRWSNILAMIKNNRADPQICTDDYKKKLVVITGATSGIGYFTAREFASHGANLLCINRNLKKSKALRCEIEKEYAVRCDYKIADLSILADIRRVSEELANLKAPIDVLIHNAGVYLTKKEVTPDGLEKVFAVHYLSSFIINYILLEKLKSQKSSRIILVNSEGHRFAAWGLRLDDLNWERRRYSGLGSYGSAKTAQLLSMMVFNERVKNTGVTINAIHPGAVKTESGRENGPVYLWFRKNFIDKSLKSPDVSAQALYYLGVSSQVEGLSGKFFNLTTEEEPAPPALDKEVGYLLWEKSLEMSKLQRKLGKT